MVNDFKLQDKEYEICFITHRELLRFLHRSVTRTRLSCRTINLGIVGRMDGRRKRLEVVGIQ